MAGTINDELEQFFAETKDFHDWSKDRVSEIERAVVNLDAKFDEKLELVDTRFQKLALDTGPDGQMGSGRVVEGRKPFLSLEQRIAPHFGSRREAAPAYDASQVRFGALVAAFVGGDHVRPQLNDYELQALSGTTTGSAGGFLVPEAIGSIFIDSVRPRMRVLEAGARSYALEAQVVHLPGWDDLLQASWRSEAAAFSEQTPDFRRVTLAAKSIAVRVRLPVELIEDSAQNLEPVVAIIEAEVGRAIAEGIDAAALVGTGADNQPLGLMNLDTSTGINEVSMGANGATPTDYDKFLDALYELEADNFEASAVIWHPRTPHTLSKLVTGITSDKTKLAAPPRIAELPKLPTTAVPIDQVQGSSSDASTAFFGAWENLVIGFRPDIALRSVVDPYSEGGSGIVNLYIWQRADVGVLQPKAFSRLVGIRP